MATADTDIKLDQIPPYLPSAEDQKRIAKVEAFFTKGCAIRKPHEGQWFINGAMIRGQQWLQWDELANTLSLPPAPRHRVRRSFNLILPKVQARQAKFLKNRPHPEVKAATTDIKDILDARMTTKALDYLWRKLRIEERYAQGLQWTTTTGHGYLWISWDPSKLGRVQYQDEAGQKQVEEAKLGDIELEVDGPFSLLVDDPAISHLGDQPAIMRVKLRPLTYVRERFSEAGKFVKPEADEDQSVHYERSLAALNSATTTGFGEQAGRKQGTQGEPTHVIVKEYLEKPSAHYPAGCYIVVGNGVLLKTQDELPYELSTMPNPYPVVDFPDLSAAGQYWITTIVEQMVPPQRQYNVLRCKLEEHFKVALFQKLLVAKQHMIAPGAWTDAPGELVEYVAHPGIAPPQAWSPPPLAGDIWRALDILRGEIDAISHIYPEAEGQVGQSKSGFQTNLLQEATDAVHGPAIRTHELAIEELSFKLRHMMQLMYDIPRLIAITSHDDQVEAFEFSNRDIDPNADIIVQAGSGLPTLKGARIQMALELRNAGVFGNLQDPEVNRKVLSMLEMGEFGNLYADSRRDEERARLENVQFVESNEPVDPPLFCDNHNIHYTVHTDDLKSPDFKTRPVERQQAQLEHILVHMVYINPAAAGQVAAIYGLPVPQLPQPPMPTQVPPEQGQGQQQPPQAGPPPGPQGPQPPPPEAAASGNSQFNSAFGFGAQGTEAGMM